jgi:serine phosphatase RsbU (regulator of sigma subunit)
VQARSVGGDCYDFLDAGEGRKEFGEARLVRTIMANRGREVRVLLDVVFEEVRRFSDGEQADDQTMVIARVR